MAIVHHSLVNASTTWSTPSTAPKPIISGNIECIDEVLRLIVEWFSMLTNMLVDEQFQLVSSDL
jgi:hypothetical protein